MRVTEKRGNENQGGRECCGWGTVNEFQKNGNIWWSKWKRKKINMKTDKYKVRFDKISKIHNNVMYTDQHEMYHAL